jgi:hypothetical protein
MVARQESARATIKIVSRVESAVWRGHENMADEAQQDVSGLVIKNPEDSIAENRKMGRSLAS